MRPNSRLTAVVAIGAMTAIGALVYTESGGMAETKVSAAEEATKSARLSAGSPASRQQPDRIEVAQNAATGETLPGGATSLTETFGDWQVICAQAQTGRRCGMAQNQVQKNGQRVLAVEFRAQSETGIEGIAALPFGLDLESGASLRIDDGAAAQPLRFKTCLPAGCIVPLNLDPATITALRAGTLLKIGTQADGGQEQIFSVSLKGFSAALDRINELQK